MVRDLLVSLPPTLTRKALLAELSRIEGVLILGG